MRTNHFIALSFCLATIFTACGNSKNSTAASDSIALSEIAPATASITITDKKWKLVELMGTPVSDSVNGKEPFMMLKMADSSYAANGGCNGLGGKFVLDEKLLRIKFTQGMSTMMACPDMSIEEGLNKVFGDADNYSVNDSMLSLNKARMAPLAQFKAIEQTH